MDPALLSLARGLAEGSQCVDEDVYLQAADALLEYERPRGLLRGGMPGGRGRAGSVGRGGGGAPPPPPPPPQRGRTGSPARGGVVRPRVASKSPSGRRYTHEEMQAAIEAAKRNGQLEAQLAASQALNAELRTARWCSATSCTNPVLWIVLALCLAVVLLYSQSGRLVSAAAAAGRAVADDVRGHAGLGHVRAATGASQTTNFTARAYSGDGTSIVFEFPGIAATTPPPSAPRAASNSSGGGSPSASTGAGSGGGSPSASAGAGSGGGSPLGRGGGGGSPSASAGAGARSSSPLGRGGGGGSSSASEGLSREGRDSDGRGATPEGKLVATLSANSWVPELAGVPISALGKQETTAIRNYCEYVVARANLAAKGAFVLETTANTFVKSAMDTCPPGSKCDVLNQSIIATLPIDLSELDRAVEVGRVRRVCGSPVMLPSFTSGTSVVMDMASYARLAGSAAETLAEFSESSEYQSLKNLGSAAAAGVLGAFTKTVGLGGGSLLTNDQIEMRLSELAALPPPQLEAYLTSARAQLEAGIDAGLVQSVTSVLAYMLNSCSGDGDDGDAGAYDAGAAADEDEIPKLEPVRSRGYGAAGGDSSLALSGGARGASRSKGRAPRLSLWVGTLYHPPRLVGGSMKLYAAPRLVGGGGSARRGSSAQHGTAPTVAQQAVAMDSMKHFYSHLSTSGLCGSPILRFCMALLTGIGTLLMMKFWTPTVVWESIASLLWSYQNGSSPLPKTWDWMTMFGQFLAGVEGTSPNDNILKQIVHSIYLILTWAYTQAQQLIVAIQFEYSLTGKLPQADSDGILKTISLFTLGRWSLSLFLWLFEVVGMAMMHLGDFFCKALTTGVAMSMEALFKTLHLPSLGQRLLVVAYSNWMGREEGERVMQFYEGLNAKQQKDLAAMAARRAAEAMEPLAATLGIKEADKKALDAKLAAAAQAPKKASPKKASPKKAAPKKASPKKAAPKRASPKKASPKKAAPKKEAPKKASPKKRSPKKASPKKAAPKKARL